MVTFHCRGPSMIYHFILQYFLFINCISKYTNIHTRYLALAVAAIRSGLVSRVRICFVNLLLTCSTLPSSVSVK